MIASRIQLIRRPTRILFWQACQLRVPTRHSYRVRVFSCLSAVIWTMSRPITMLLLASVEGGLAVGERNGRYHVGSVVPRSAINKRDLGPRPRVRHKDEYGVTVAFIDVSFPGRTSSTFKNFTVVRAHRRIYLQYLFWTESQCFHLSLLFPRLSCALFACWSLMQYCCTPRYQTADLRYLVVGQSQVVTIMFDTF